MIDIPIPITVLTQPVPWINPLQQKIFPIASQILNYTKNVVIQKNSGNIAFPQYGGHFAVTRSLIEGLQKINHPFNYNPKAIADVNENVIVLASIEALIQAITFKRKGIIKKLFAGPNLVILPSDNYEIITAEEIDRIIVNCNWTYNAYIEDAPPLQSKSCIWPAGVNSDYWCPKTTSKSNKNIIFYKKLVNEEIISPIRESVMAMGFNVIDVNYGDYSVNEFLINLQKSELAIFFSHSESQGLALCEAWSSNVPTFVWRGENQYTRGNKVIQCSSAPYLSDCTGTFFTNKNEIITNLKEWDTVKLQFNPRDWILKNMTDEICARKLLQCFDEVTV